MLDFKGRIFLTCEIPRALDMFSSHCHLYQEERLSTCSKPLEAAKIVFLVCWVWTLDIINCRAVQQLACHLESSIRYPSWIWGPTRQLATRKSSPKPSERRVAGNWFGGMVFSRSDPLPPTKHRPRIFLPRKLWFN